LEEVLPPTWRLHSMIADIYQNMEAALESEEKLLEIVDKYPPPRKVWSESCSRGDKLMGYTCGLWQLFHIMTRKFSLKGKRIHFEKFADLTVRRIFCPKNAIDHSRSG